MPVVVAKALEGPPRPPKLHLLMEEIREREREKEGGKGDGEVTRGASRPLDGKVAPTASMGSKLGRPAPIS